jgi:hypothetical protein
MLVTGEALKLGKGIGPAQSVPSGTYKFSPMRNHAIAIQSRSHEAEFLERLTLEPGFPMEATLRSAGSGVCGDRPGFVPANWTEFACAYISPNRRQQLSPIGGADRRYVHTTYPNFDAFSSAVYHQPVRLERRSIVASDFHPAFETWTGQGQWLNDANQYVGPFKGLAPHGDGQCFGPSGQQACTYVDGVRLRTADGGATAASACPSGQSCQVVN